MKKLVLLAAILAVTAACEPKSLTGEQIIGAIFKGADERGMHIIVETNITGGGLFEEGADLETIVSQQDCWMRRFYARYGDHPSFEGWYYGNEINPVDTLDEAKSYFWRALWGASSKTAKELNPDALTTISPFFILDKDEWRGFRYFQPEEYRVWWAESLRKGGIDILMLQDSGAEHQAFFSIEERRPFIEAFAAACSQAGAQFWVNVETGQVRANDWPDAVAQERERRRAWEFTPIDLLAQKLDLAAQYATGTINWGYYPLMTPTDGVAVSLKDIDGQKAIDLSTRKDNYEAYRAYVASVPQEPAPGHLIRPVLGGTLWWLPGGIDALPRKEAFRAIEDELDNLHAVGIDRIILGSLPKYFDE
ncbi:MAG: DUF4434 domain-containing protein [Bacteroidales bacterium]|nr:DUF4434 domain-containing protein [Bacteroidales bacterium]